jgi:subtilisin family serine protease
MSGTSMACPHVAGAVALLRQVSPNATVEEVFDALFMTAEDLGVTGEDNAYGNGLIHLPEASRYLLPLSNEPYLVYSGSTVDDGNNGLPEPGETFDLISHLGNMGANATSVSATLHSSDPFVQIVSGSSLFGAINSQSVGDNSSNPFVVSLDASTPGSHFVDFVIDIEANGGAYTTQLEFSLLTPFALELQDHDVGNVVFSVSDGGRFGFDNLDLTNGSGFIFPSGGNNWLFEGALLVGTDTLHVSHSARGTPAGPVETDWQVSPGGNIVITEPGAFADEEGYSVYTDIGAPNPLDMGIVQESYAFSGDPDDDYVIVMLRMTSLSPDSGSIVNNIYMGLFMDWDVSTTGNEYLTNDGAMNREYDVGYMYRSLSPSYPYVGVSVLSDMGMTGFHLINNQNSEYNFTRAEFFGSLSGGFVDTLRTGGDYSFVIATGPFSLPAGDTLTTAFAVLAGEGLADLASNIQAARVQWDRIDPVGINDPAAGGSGSLPKSYALSQNYPNPFNPTTSITFSIVAEGEKTEPVPARLRVFNMRGQLVKTLIDREMIPGNHSVIWDGRDESGLNVGSGVYIYTLEAGEFRIQRKMVLLK